jgi:hypothetical protein
LTWTALNFAGVDEAALDPGRHIRIVAARRERADRADSELIVNPLYLWHAGDDVLDFCLHLLGGHLSGDQDLAVEAGEVDMRVVASRFADACAGLPFDAFVVGLGAQRSPVEGRQGAAASTGGEHRQAALQHRQQYRAEQQAGGEKFLHSSTPMSRQSMPSQRQWMINRCIS